jgi:hypothetical protein
LKPVLHAGEVSTTSSSVVVAVTEGEEPEFRCCTRLQGDLPGTLLLSKRVTNAFLWMLPNRALRSQRFSRERLPPYGIEEKQEIAKEVARNIHTVFTYFDQALAFV